MPFILKPLLLKFYYLQLKVFLYNNLYYYYNLVIFRHCTHTDFHNCLTLAFKRKKRMLKNVNLNCQEVTERQVCHTS